MAKIDVLVNKCECYNFSYILIYATKKIPQKGQIEELRMILKNEK